MRRLILPRHKTAVTTTDTRIIGLLVASVLLGPSSTLLLRATLTAMPIAALRGYQNSPQGDCRVRTGLREETAAILLRFKDHPGMVMSSTTEVAAQVFPQSEGWIRVLGAPSLDGLRQKARTAKQEGIPYEGLGHGLGSRWTCNATTGLGEPLPVCTAIDPCTRPAPELGVSMITTSSDAPICRTSQPGRATFDDGPPLRWTDSQGVNRYACLYQPPGASPTSPRPLVVWLHGGGAGMASDVYNYTSLRAKAVNYDLTGDSIRRGFFLLSIQGRSLHYPTYNPRDGHHHDFYYRDLNSPSRNPDIANLDRLIDELVKDGSVDAQRIYVMGWSNGGFFGQMYAIARHATPTPGGHRVAAAAVYSAADPFNNIRPDQVPSCQLDPYPKSNVPIFLVSRACDIVACNEAQVQSFATQGYIVDPGQIVEPWIADLGTKVNNPNVTWRIVAGTGSLVSACTSAVLCSQIVALVNHLRWPDGVADGSAVDHESAMLDFLRAHPLRQEGSKEGESF